MTTLENDFFVDRGKNLVDAGCPNVIPRALDDPEFMEKLFTEFKL